jgi:hypothetical protein
MGKVSTKVETTSCSNPIRDLTGNIQIQQSLFIAEEAC